MSWPIPSVAPTALPLRYLFIDMNSYFASVEQQDQPQLRGKPVGIVPMMTDSTCCIAASYEAKYRGVKTGTPVWEAKKKCPEIKLVVADHEKYVRCHHEIINCVNSHLPVEKVCSIDEMSCKLLANEQPPEICREIALNIKKEIAGRVGPFIKSSVGIAPNRWLAKVATDIEKPDGLTLLTEDRVPSGLYGLDLSDLPGIGRQMYKRLMAKRVTTVEQLCNLREHQLQSIWGSRIIGSQWWLQLRGEDLPFIKTQRRTVGHSHVLAPEMRTHDKARGVSLRMMQKAARRLRRLEYVAGEMSLYISFREGHRWLKSVSVPQVADTLTLAEHFSSLWPEQPLGTPMKVAVTLYKLTHNSGATDGLFQNLQKRKRVAGAMDKIADRYGQGAIGVGGTLGYQRQAETRISFTQIPDFDEFTE